MQWRQLVHNVPTECSQSVAALPMASKSHKVDVSENLLFKAETEQADSEAGLSANHDAPEKGVSLHSPTLHQPEELGWHIPSMPKYQMMESAQISGQSRALHWMTADGRARFRQKERDILGLWGLAEYAKVHHAGTCLLVPLDWADMDPFTLEKSNRFDPKNLPEESALRMVCAQLESLDIN